MRRFVGAGSFSVASSRKSFSSSPSSRFTRPEANQTVLTTVAVAGSFLAFIPVAWWLARTTSSPVLHGTLMGAAGAAIYILLTVVGRQFDPNAPPAPWIYYVGHALKLAGGATGGWLATGRRLRNQDSVVRIQYQFRNRNRAACYAAHAKPEY